MRVRDIGKCTATEVTVALYRVMFLRCNTVYTLVLTTSVYLSVLLCTYSNITYDHWILIANCID